MIRILNNWLNIIFILSIIAIVSALVAEFFFTQDQNPAQAATLWDP